MGDVCAVGGSVHELKIREGPGYPVYFGNEGINLILLIGGGTKRTQAKDIESARRLWTGRGR